MAEKILTMHPEGKKSVRISRAKYDAMRGAILEALKEKPTLTHDELVSAVENHLRGKFDGSIGWYMESTKLDLLARGVIQKIEGPRLTTYRLK